MHFLDCCIVCLSDWRFIWYLSHSMETMLATMIILGLNWLSCVRIVTNDIQLDGEYLRWIMVIWKKRRMLISSRASNTGRCGIWEVDSCWVFVIKSTRVAGIPILRNFNFWNCWISTIDDVERYLAKGDLFVWSSFLQIWLYGTELSYDYIHQSDVAI